MTVNSEGIAQNSPEVCLIMVRNMPFCRVACIENLKSNYYTAALAVIITSNKLNGTLYTLTHTMVNQGLSGYKWASTQENLSSGFANNKGTDQPAHLHSLISAFVIQLLESFISRLATSKISIF